jgi:FAD:protein FMN transferase
MRAHRPFLNRRAFLALTGAATATGVFSAPALARNAPAVETFTGTAFGTGWRIRLPGGTETSALRADVTTVLDEVDRQMSPYRSDSDLSRLNTAAAGRCAAPAEMLDVTRAALDLAAASDGRFDPTVGPLVARWGFGPIAGDPQADWTGLTLEPGAIVKDHARLTLDLCGIAKGYALDRLAHRARAAGHDAFLIDLGGELIARGQHPSGRPWHVGIEDPRRDVEGLAEVLGLTDQAVATSGDRENGYTLGDRRYSHIIAPDTGQPVAGPIASVSVIAASAMEADGWATALMAAGSTAGPELARRNGLAALFLLRAGDGLARVTTGAFDSHLA